MNQPVKRKKRKLYFRALKKAMTVRYHQPRFVFLGEKPTQGAIILSNHEGTDAPMALEIYLNIPMRMWGAHEMNSGVINTYLYQSKVYYHKKKHWNIWAARAFCLIASPLSSLFYSGFDLISTYRDARLKTTIMESIDAIQKGDNIVIFPEVSDKGYLKELEGFHAGFVLLAKQLAKRDIDVPIYVSYYRKEDNTYLFDAPVLFSQLTKDGATKEEITQKLCTRCNELGKMAIPHGDLIHEELDTLHPKV